MLKNEASLENILSPNEGMDANQKSDNQAKRTSYYVEENEKLLNLLITNCEPILSELSNLIDHFNTYNGIQKVVERS